MKETIPRGNIQKFSQIAVALTPTALVASTTTPLSFTVKGLQLQDFVSANLIGAAQTAGVGIVNCRVTAADTLEILFSNSTAGTPTPTVGTYTLLICRSEDNTLPANAT